MAGVQQGGWKRPGLQRRRSVPGADATVWDEDLDGDEKAPMESPEGLRHGR